MADDPSGSGGSWRPPRVERVEALAEYGVTLKILGSVRAADQWAAGGELPQAPAGGVRGQRHRDPAAAARRPVARPRRGPRRARRPGPGRPRRRHGLRLREDRPPLHAELRDGSTPTPARPGTDRRPARPRPQPTGRVEWPAVESAARCPRERRAALAARDREPPRRVAHLPAGGRRSSPRRTRRPTCTTRPRPTSRPSGPSSRASGSTGRRRSTTTLEWDLPFAKWFAGGELNVAYNCVDRHVERGLGDKVAYHWIGEPGDTRTITYARPPARGQQGRQRAPRAGRRDRRPGRHLHADDPGAADRDARLRPASARPHTVVFGGFSAEALGGRINDCGGQGAHHRGRRLAPRQGGRPQAGRRGARADAPRSRRPSSSGGSAATARHGRRVATSGGTTSSTASPRTARRSRSTRSTCSTCSTRRARPPSPRASCTRPPATCSGRRSPTRSCSTSSPTTSTGARPTSAG